MGNEALPAVSAIPGLQPLYTSRIDIAPPLDVGNGPHGQRRVINILGGAFAGPRLSGRVLPGGADWQMVRSDGSVEVSARYTLETHDGALIYVGNWGLRRGPSVMRIATAEQRYHEPGVNEDACGHSPWRADSASSARFYARGRGAYAYDETETPRGWRKIQGYDREFI